MIRSIYCEAKKLIFSRTFVVGSFLVIVLCMMTTVYNDYTSGKTYTFIELLLLHDEQLRLSLSGYEVFFNGLENQYSMLFLPLSVSITFIPLYCIERKSGMLRMQIIRQSKIQFTIARIIGSMICSGLVVMIGFLAFGLIVYILLPHSVNVDNNLIVTNLLKIIAAKFLEGVELSCPPLLLYMIMNDVYFIICIPVLYYFIIDTVAAIMFDSSFGILFLYLKITGVERVLFQFNFVGLTIVTIFPICIIIAFTMWNKHKEDCGA